MSKYNKDVIWTDLVGDPNSEKGNNGYVGDLMKIAEQYINKQYDMAHITGSEVGQIMSAMIPSSFQTAIEYGSTEKIRELEIDKLNKEIEIMDKDFNLREAESKKQIELADQQIKSEIKNNESGGLIDKRIAEIGARIALVTKQESELGLNGSSKRDIEAKQLDSVTKDVEKKTEDLAVLTAIRANRIAQSGKNLEKLSAEIAYLLEQKTQLTASVGYNNNIKALDAYASTIGTLGAGGNGISKQMWAVYYGMINNLTSISAPSANDITVTKIT